MEGLNLLGLKIMKNNYMNNDKTIKKEQTVVYNICRKCIYKTSTFMLSTKLCLLHNGCKTLNAYRGHTFKIKIMFELPLPKYVKGIRQ